MNEVSVRVEPRPSTQPGSLRVPERTLELLRDLVQARTGMHYDDARLHFLRDRITPLAIDRGFDSLLDYYYLLKYDNASDAEWLRVIDTLAVQETYFWREADQLRALTDVIVPALAARGRHEIRIWSLPCASGEEPLSIVMALTQAGWYARLPIEVHASDASELALTRARAGVYGERAFRQLPADLRERYFTATGRGEWRIDPTLHRRVLSWTRVNAVAPAEWPVHAAADVVFCRNLFIYFDGATVEQVTRDFAGRMRAPGYLCVAAAESLLRLKTPFTLEDVGGAFVYVQA